MAYETTTVPVSRTQEAIRNLCLKHEMAGVQFTENFGPPRITVRFAKEVAGNLRTVQISVPLDQAVMEKPARHRYGYGYRAKPQEPPAEKHRKQRWRALYYNLKAMFEAVDFGIQTFEQAFLSHFEWMLPSGEVTTVGNIIIPRLSQATSGPLLPAPVPEASVEGQFREADQCS